MEGIFDKIGKNKSKPKPMSPNSSPKNQGKRRMLSIKNKPSKLFQLMQL